MSVIDHTSKELEELDDWAYTLEYKLLHEEYANRSELQRKLIVIKNVISKMLKKQQKNYGQRIYYTCDRRRFGLSPYQNTNSFPFNPFNISK